MSQPTRPANLPEGTPRFIQLDPDGPQKGLEKLESRLWKFQPTAKKASDDRAGGGVVSQARLDVEDDIEKAIEEAFTIARDNLMRRVEGGQ